MSFRPSHLSYEHTERQRQRHHPIEIHCDAPKSVPDPFRSVTLYIIGSNLTLDPRCVHTLSAALLLAV